MNSVGTLALGEPQWLENFIAEIIEKRHVNDEVYKFQIHRDSNLEGNLRDYYCADSYHGLLY